MNIIIQIYQGKILSDSIQLFEFWRHLSFNENGKFPKLIETIILKKSIDNDNIYNGFNIVLAKSLYEHKTRIYL